MQDKQKKTEEIFHLKNRKPIIIVIEKNNHAINKQHPGLFLYFRIRFQKPKAIQIFFFSKTSPNLFLNYLFLPASFLVSNENQAKNQISKQTKPSK